MRAESTPPRALAKEREAHQRRTGPEFALPEGMKEMPCNVGRAVAKTSSTVTRAPRFGRLHVGLLVAAALISGLGCPQANDGVGDPIPSCTPHDVARHPPNASQTYPYAALPTGACAPLGYRCAIGIYGPCGDDPEYVGHPYTGYECACRSGTWRCDVTVRSASVCSNRAHGDGGSVTRDAIADHNSVDLEGSHDVNPNPSVGNAGFCGDTLPSSPPDAPDASTDLVDAAAQEGVACESLDFDACLSRGGCHPIHAFVFENVCTGRGFKTILGCTSRGFDGGAGIIISWARDKAGRYARFGTTEIPAGWVRVDEPPSCTDGGWPDV
jgi:hypothetical protein